MSDLRLLHPETEEELINTRNQFELDITFMDEVDQEKCNVVLERYDEMLALLTGIDRQTIGNYND